MKGEGEAGGGTWRSVDSDDGDVVAGGEVEAEKALSDGGVADEEGEFSEGYALGPEPADGRWGDAGELDDDGGGFGSEGVDCGRRGWWSVHGNSPFLGGVAGGDGGKYTYVQYTEIGEEVHTFFEHLTRFFWEGH